jgi:small redox-active disulfide protein 2
VKIIQWVELMEIKILGSGCPACQSMHNDVIRIIERTGMVADVEYVQDIPRILSYGVMSTPVLVIDEKVVMIGHRGAKKIEEMLQRSAEERK